MAAMGDAGACFAEWTGNHRLLSAFGRFGPFLSSLKKECSSPESPFPCPDFGVPIRISAFRKETTVLSSPSNGKGGMSFEK